MRPIATAQTTYASGAAAPSAAAAAAGRRKIPPPTVTLTMLAARPQTPSARTSERSFVSRVTGEGRCGGHRHKTRSQASTRWREADLVVRGPHSVRWCHAAHIRVARFFRRRPDILYLRRFHAPCSLCRVPFPAALPAPARFARRACSPAQPQTRWRSLRSPTPHSVDSLAVATTAIASRSTGASLTGLRAGVHMRETARPAQPVMLARTRPDSARLGR